MSDFLAELRRRRVVRVAVVYAAAGFAVIQAADAIFPHLMLPPWSVGLVVWLTILGLPLALVLSWLFDWTAHGVQRTHGEGPAAESHGAAAPAWIGRRTVLAAGALLLLGGGLGAGWYLRPVTEGTTWRDTQALTIAALPFDNLSASDDDRFFTDGIHDEILTQLSKIAALRVISRTSVLPYRDSDKGLRLIAQELGARYVLEGSVRRGGTGVRVTAQLIDARTDGHVWAETYDRPMDDVLAIQSDVATRIAAALRARLTPEERRRIETPGTRDPVAAELFLRARGINTARRAGADVAIELYRGAIERDPRYAAAWAGLAGTYGMRVLSHGYPREWADSGAALARHAITLDSDLADGHAALGFNLLLLGRLHQARTALERAVELSPSLADPADQLGWLERELGRFDVSARWSRRAIAVDPSSADPLQQLGATLRAAREFDAAEQWIQRSLDIEPDHQWAFLQLVWVDLDRQRFDPARERVRALLRTQPDHITGLFVAGDVALFAGDWTEARDHYERIFALMPDARLAGVWFSVRTGLATALFRLGDRTRAALLFEQALADAHARLDRGEEIPAIFAEVAAIHAVRGETQLALDWIERACDAGWRFQFLETMEYYRELLDEPRFRRVMERLRGEVAATRQRMDLEGPGSRVSDFPPRAP
jgi:adenylate cyclase